MKKNGKLTKTSPKNGTVSKLVQKGKQNGHKSSK